MKRKILTEVVRKAILVLATVLLAAAPSFAMDIYLVAQEFTKTINGTDITMWGFAEADPDFADVGPASSPGPVIEIPPGDTVLNIYLRNDLAAVTGEPVSIVIPGQTVTLNPEFNGNRVTSFTHTAPTEGGMATYTWNNLQPGTFIYHSGSHPGLQVHMGLYGVVKKEEAAGQGYAGISYTKEVIVVYSEIDSTLHDPPVVAKPLNYKPEYFLVNGKPFEAGEPNLLAGGVGQNTLIRFINAGLKSHVPTLRGGYWTVVAEDGHVYPYPKQQYNVFLPAMKTIDVIWTPSSQGVYPVFDARHFLTTNQEMGGGMLTYLQVGPP